jgi:hypothetical protein
MPQPRKDRPGVVEQHGGAVAVADITGGHPHSEQQAKAVDEQVALAAVDLLGAVLGAVKAVPAPRSVILTLWLSRIPALGVGSRPWRRRSCSRSTVRICAQRPSRRQSRK